MKPGILLFAAFLVVLSAPAARAEKSDSRVGSADDGAAAEKQPVQQREQGLPAPFSGDSYQEQYRQGFEPVPQEEYGKQPEENRGRMQGEGRERLLEPDERGEDLPRGRFGEEQEEQDRLRKDRPLDEGYDWEREPGDELGEGEFEGGYIWPDEEYPYEEYQFPPDNGLEDLQGPGELDAQRAYAKAGI